MDAEGTFGPGAEVPLDLLTDDDREEIQRAFGELTALPRDQWAAKGAQPLASDATRFLFPVNPDLYGVFSIAETGQPLLETALRPETLSPYFQHKHRQERQADDQ